MVAAGQSARERVLDHTDVAVTCHTRGVAPSAATDHDPLSIISFSDGGSPPLTLTVRHCSRKSVHTGGHVWSASLLLARWLHSRCARLDGVGLLELGCGLGVPSLVAARAGAKVVATDELPSLLEHVELNARRNECNIEVRRLDFNGRSDVRAAAACGAYDLILFADIVYGQSGGSGLPYAIATLLLAAPPGAAAVGAFPSQVRDGTAEFWEHAERVLTWHAVAADGAKEAEDDPRAGRLYIFTLLPESASTIADSAWATEEEGCETSPLEPLFAPSDDEAEVEAEDAAKNLRRTGDATAVAADPSAPTSLSELADDVLERIACALTQDLCAGVRSLCMLSRCDQRLHDLALRADMLSRCAAQHGLAGSASSASLPLLDVLETVTGLGTNRIFFSSGRRPLDTETTPTLRPGSSMPRLVEFALLMRRHPTLSVCIDGHAGTHECMTYQTNSGGTVQVQSGIGHRRAEAVRRAFLDLECLERLDARGNKVWGRMPTARFAPRITARGWDDAVSAIAGWSGGLNTCHAECFFRIGGSGHEVPTRPDHYALAAASFEEGVGWRRHFEDHEDVAA